MSNSKSAAAADPLIIKKYANRRLYNTGSSSYVTLEDLASLVQVGQVFTVTDAKTGEDITRAVLTQIIVEKESRGRNLLPESFLRQLIACYDHGVEKLVPGYLELCMDRLHTEQDRVSKELYAVSPGEGHTRDLIHDYAHKNWATFETALSSLFASLKAKISSRDAESDSVWREPVSPDPLGLSEGETISEIPMEANIPEQNSLQPSQRQDTQRPDLASLQDQLTSLQRKIDDLAGHTGAKPVTE